MLSRTRSSLSFWGPYSRHDVQLKTCRSAPIHRSADRKESRQTKGGEEGAAADAEEGALLMGVDG